MAFCNNDCRCGDSCTRQDDHGGSCDCNKDTCKVKTCPRCGHLMMHHHEKGYRGGYGCDERMSYDNNDFCGCSHGAPAPTTYTFYAVADNKDLSKAKWYRTYSANRSSGWKKDFDDAKIWTKRSSAKSKATSLGAQAVIVEFHVTKVIVVDQVEHLKKVAEERIQREKKRLQAEHEAAVRRAKEDLDRAIARLQNLEGKK